VSSKLAYERLRVRLRRAPWPLESDLLWGKKLSRTGWTYFEPEEFRDGRWMGLAWQLIKSDDLLRIEGKVRNRWQPVSTWLIERNRRRRQSLGQPRRQGGATAVVWKAGTVEEIREVLSSVSGRQPGRGELAFHLLVHVVKSREETVELMTGLAWDVRPTDLAELRRNGRDRLAGGLTCRFCVKRRPK
jgi:hypothetical protein